MRGLGYPCSMTYTERDENQNSVFEDEHEQDRKTNSNGSKDKLPFAPAKDDKSPLGSTDQHSDA